MRSSEQILYAGSAALALVLLAASVVDGVYCNHALGSCAPADMFSSDRMHIGTCAVLAVHALLAASGAIWGPTRRVQCYCIVTFCVDLAVSLILHKTLQRYL